MKYAMLSPLKHCVLLLLGVLWFCHNNITQNSNTAGISQRALSVREADKSQGHKTPISFKKVPFRYLMLRNALHYSLSLILRCRKTSSNSLNPSYWARTLVLTKLDSNNVTVSVALVTSSVQWKEF